MLKIKKILISQPKPEDGKSPYYDIAEKYNVKIDFRPFIKVETVSAKEFRNQRINVPDYSAVVFTSRTGIDNFFTLCKEMRLFVNEDAKYFCVSEAVAFYLQKHIQFRKRRVFYGAGKLADMLSIISKHETEKFLFVLPENNNEEILDFLKNAVFEYKTAIVYRVVSNNFTDNEPFDYDMMIFFSPQGVASLLKNFPNFQQGEIYIGCLGTAATQAAKEAGWRVDLEVPTPKFSSMTTALDDFMKQHRKHLI